MTLKEKALELVDHIPPRAVHSSDGFDFMIAVLDEASGIREQNEIRKALSAGL